MKKKQNTLFQQYYSKNSIAFPNDYPKIIIKIFCVYFTNYQNVYK